MRNTFVIVTVLVIALIAAMGLQWPLLWWLLLPVLPLAAMGVQDMMQSRHSIRRNFPLIGRGRWVMEKLRPYIRQYFIESDTDGAPISRMYRNIVYQRAKTAMESVAFGSRVDTYRSGYEWIGHSLGAIDVADVAELRVTIGGPQCRHPYNASILNISAMSYGALSPNAILAMNQGAKIGGFAQNTGEGGISEFHLRHGGDLIWQIGTGYFGCRNEKGGFSEEAFRERAALDAVKMIEIKLSQGAKPGHGGILPAEKNTPAIAAARGVAPGVQINSPPGHSAFDSPRGLMAFIEQLRELSGGKPVGFKLAIGRESEFMAICKAMVATGIRPDFITVDGSEGGTGAAPLEYANSVGMPLRDALALVDNCLIGFGVRGSIKVIASGKIFTGFHLVKHLALGADLCNSGRGMMLASGCVHSLTCNSNHCPSGVATQNPALYGGLVVSDKAPRVARFHERTIHATADLIASAGLHHTNELNRTHIFRRINQNEIRRYDEVFPYVRRNALLGDEIPERYTMHMHEADADQFTPRRCLTRMKSDYLETMEHHEGNEEAIGHELRSP
ncbi:MAG: FMN-binding glutamate synthase family protein [Pseudohongiellaceae bacterium]